MEKNDFLPPIIIGTSHHNTYSVVKAFALQNIKPVVILHDCKRSFISHSRYVSKTYFIGSIENLFKLLTELRCKTTKQVLIPCSELSST